MNTDLQNLMRSAAAWATGAVNEVAQSDQKFAALTNAALEQNWPLVVCVTLNRLQVDLCLVNPEGQMQSLQTTRVEALPDAIRTN